MKLSLAIVVHRPDSAQLVRTLAALDAAVRGLPAGIATALVVADNSPPAALLPTAQRGQLLAACPHIPSREWVILPQNRGFGAAHNRVLAMADSDLHLILNPDLELAPAALAAGVRWLQAQPATLAVTPWVSDAGGHQQFLGKRYPSVWVLFLRAFAPGWLRRRCQARLDDYEARDLQAAGAPTAAVPIASGACLLCRTAALRAVGGFDERYFLYFEDFDLSLRLRRRGDIVFLPAMRAVHHGGDAAHKGWRHIRWFCASAVRFFSRFGWRWR